MSNENTEHRGVEQTEARLVNLQEVAGSTPAPATTEDRPRGEAVKRGPGRPRKVQPEPVAEQGAIAVAVQDAPAPPKPAPAVVAPPPAERPLSIIVQQRRNARDTVRACVQLDVGGPIFHILIQAAEDLPAGVELELVPHMPHLLRVRRK
jgi:hypothetical protein